MDEVIQSAPEAVEPQVETQQVAEQSTPQVDPYEEAAREQGWRPKEEFAGDPEKW